jgi:hypothetical protein
MQSVIDKIVANQKLSDIVTELQNVIITDRPEYSKIINESLFESFKCLDYSIEKSTKDGTDKGYRHRSYMSQVSIP